MPPPNNPAVAKVALHVQRDTRSFINTFHVSKAGGGVLSAADLPNIANVFADWWLNSYRLGIPLQVVGQDITVTKLDPSDPLQYVAYIAAAGGGGSSPLPADATAAISWRTGLAGRKYRGRFYDFSLPNATVNTNDTLISGTIAGLTAVGQYLLTHLLTAGFKAVVFHRSDNTATDIVSVIVDQLVDSMRNRLAGRGD